MFDAKCLGSKTVRLLAEWRAFGQQIFLVVCYPAVYHLNCTMGSNIETHVTAELAKQIVECCRLQYLKSSPLWQDYIVGRSDLCISPPHGVWTCLNSIKLHTLSCKAAMDSSTNKAPGFSSRKVADTRLNILWESMSTSEQYTRKMWAYGLDVHIQSQMNGIFMHLLLHNKFI